MKEDKIITPNPFLGYGWIKESQLEIVHEAIKRCYQDINHELLDWAMQDDKEEILYIWTEGK